MEEFKVGDRVNFLGLGNAEIIEIFYRVRTDTGIYANGHPSALTKIRPKVKRWKWVYGGRNFLELYISIDMYTEEEVKKALSNFQIIEKLDSTEKEFDE